MSTCICCGVMYETAANTGKLCVDCFDDLRTGVIDVVVCEALNRAGEKLGLSRNVTISIACYLNSVDGVCDGAVAHVNDDGRLDIAVNQDKRYYDQCRRELCLPMGLVDSPAK